MDAKKQIALSLGGFPSSEDVPPAVEFWNEYGVPEIDILMVGFDCLRGAHERRL
jgi:hypothetical protein